MLLLVLHALRARRAQSLAMFGLAMLAALGSAAAPWFLAWGSDAVARSAVASAPVTERLVLAYGSPRYERSAPSPMQQLRDKAAADLPVPGAQVEVGARLLVSIGPATPAPSPADNESIDVSLAARDGVCARVTLLAGACPDGTGVALLSRQAADLVGAGVGDTITVTGLRLPDTSSLVVSGVYEVTDPYEPYWAGTQLLPAVYNGDDRTPDPILVSEQTLLALQPQLLDIDMHMEIPPSDFTGPTRELSRMLARGADELGNNLTVTIGPRQLLNRISDDRDLATVGVTVGAVQLVLICWVGLFLAVRHTSEERRADIGLLKLRGATTRRAWTLAGLSSGVPMVAGTLVGAGGGFVAAVGLAGWSVQSVAHTASVDPLRALLVSVCAAVLAGLGGLLAALAAEWRTIHAPVVDLLRRVPAGHRGWRAEVGDLVLVVLAVAGVYQGYAEARAGSPVSVLALVAPALVGLALALLVARSLPPLAALVGHRALRAGRPGMALAALHLARRQGTHRVFAVLAVAGAVFTTTTLLWHSASTAFSDRAVQELGADRVLTVHAASASALLEAVRTVDPDGRYAMAVASTSGLRSSDRVLAIDTARYARVGRAPGGQPAPGELAAALQAPAPEPPTVVDGPVTLEAAADAPGTGVRLHLSTVDGEPVDVDFASLPSQRRSVPASVTGCAPACRLLSLEVVGLPSARTSPVTVEVFGLSQPGGSVLSGQTLGDMTRWRGSFAKRTVPPTIGAQQGRLTIVVPAQAPPASLTLDTRVLPLTTPAPLPVVLAGPTPVRDGGDPLISALDGGDVPFRVAATVAALPLLGDRGVLVDLEYVLRSIDQRSGAADLAVWLTADAPATLVTALADHGVTVIADQSVTARAHELAQFGPGLALRFEYFAVVVVLLLAAGVAVVGSTVEHSTRVAELAALRHQGLPARAARVAGVAGTAFQVAAATATGVAAALLARAVVSVGQAVFSDGWRLLPIPGLSPVALGLSVVAVIGIVGLAALASAARLVAAVSARAGRGGAS